MKQKPGKEFYDEIRRKAKEEQEKKDRPSGPSLEQRLGMESAHDAATTGSNQTLEQRLHMIGA